LTQNLPSPNNGPQQPPTPARRRSLGDLHLSLARNSIQQAVARYTDVSRSNFKDNPALQTKLQTQLEVLEFNLDKINNNLIRISVFGLVSRGKSAVLNALLGQKILQMGPLHGVTKWPRAVRWIVTELENPNNQDSKNQVQIELIDTPGIDEIGGEIRGEMAKEVTRQSDLILFIVAGDLTQTEQEALLELRKAQKPIILVFNKIDLYTESERNAIFHNLQELGKVKLNTNNNSETNTGENDHPVWDIVMVAAAPTPLQVRVEWPDGRINYEWESPPAEIDPLKDKLVEILNREGRSILALNALSQTRESATNLAHQVVKLKEEESEKLIWEFAKYKALVIALNPIALIDVFGGGIADLVLIRSLSQLYGLPMTSYEAGKLWQSIIASSGGLLLGELGSNVVFGISKSAAGLFTDFSTYLGVAITQASLAAYGTYAVGQAARVYLEKGCTWGPEGQDTIIKEILQQVKKDTIIERIRQELE
jgi:small GTP-binding protein